MRNGRTRAPLGFRHHQLYAGLQHIPVRGLQGVGVGYLDTSHRAWLLSSWRIMIDRYPRLGEKLVVGTWHCASKGIYGYRTLYLRMKGGTDVVRAASCGSSTIRRRTSRSGCGPGTRSLTASREAGIKPLPQEDTGAGRSETGVNRLWLPGITLTQTIM